MELVFVDIETFGLDPLQHAIFEIAIIKGYQKQVWWIDPTAVEMEAASAQALKVNHYYDRAEALENPHTAENFRLDHEFMRVSFTARADLARYLARLTADCVLAGNNVKFDQQFLEAWMRKHGAAPVWDYHVFDVPTFAAGVMYERQGHTADIHATPDFPFKSSKISKWFNVEEPQGADLHTAMADCQWAKDVYEAVRTSRVKV